MRITRTLIRLSCLLVAVALAATAAAEIYQYRDSEGNLVFTTEPRPGQTADRIIGGSRNADTEVTRPPANRANPNPTRSDRVFDSAIRQAARAYSVPFELIKAVVRVESGFDPHAVSHAGAMGLMQLMPATAESLGCDDPFDPEANIMAGTQFLRLLSERYNGDLNLILAAYNAGPGAVARSEGIPFEETRMYVQRVYGFYVDYLEGDED